MIRAIPANLAAVLLCATLACSDKGPAPQAAPATAPATHNPQPAPESVPAPAPAPAPAHRILFLGTSLSAGYGVGSDKAFPALIQQKLDSAKLPFQVINAGLSGETSAGGLRRLDWSLQQPIDVLVLELGGNDALRALPVDQLHANLDSIIVRTHRRYPQTDILLAGMEAPPNLGTAYTKSFRDVYADIARDRHVVLIPFLLDRVAARSGLNQEDGIHPNAEGHRIVAQTVWRALLPMLRKRLNAQRVPAATR